MKKFYDVLSRYVSENQPNFGNGDSVLTMLYEAYSDCNQMDRILDPVCSLCRSHERTGFIAGVRMGFILHKELNIE